MEDISVPPARPAELAAVAALRGERLVEGGSEDLGEREDRVRHFVALAAAGAGRPRVGRMILRPSGGIARERGGTVRCWIRMGR
ncbi:hypothetical protein ACFWMJ_29215 [Streptomyces hawaiiensis]|uniref:hypothetical protein n=1 Tax=Streptomyces hawaiiensis TaxID=67305 RepID=UPI0036616C26